MTQIMQIGHLPVYARVLISLVVGISIGFVLPPLSTHVHYAHNGYSLYNVGLQQGLSLRWSYLWKNPLGSGLNQG